MRRSLPQDSACSCGPAHAAPSRLCQRSARPHDGHDAVPEIKRPRPRPRPCGGASARRARASRQRAPRPAQRPWPRRSCRAQTGCAPQRRRAHQPRASFPLVCLTRPWPHCCPLTQPAVCVSTCMAARGGSRSDPSNKQHERATSVHAPFMAADRACPKSAFEHLVTARHAPDQHTADQQRPRTRLKPLGARVLQGVFPGLNCAPCTQVTTSSAYGHTGAQHAAVRHQSSITLSVHNARACGRQAPPSLEQRADRPTGQAAKWPTTCKSEGMVYWLTEAGGVAPGPGTRVRRGTRRTSAAPHRSSCCAARTRARTPHWRSASGAARAPGTRGRS